MDKPLRDLLDLIHFTEGVSARIHGVLDEAEVLRIVRQAFSRSKRYTASILLLTDGGAALRIAETSVPARKLKAVEAQAKVRLSGYRIDLDESSVYRRAARDGETVLTSVREILDELFPRQLAALISGLLNYEHGAAILAPLERHGEIVGVLAVSSTEMAELLIPAVKNLARHISAALELAAAHAEHEQTEQALREREEQFWLLLQNANDAVFVHEVSPEGPGKFIEVNEQACRTLGYTREELLGMTVLDIDVPEQHPRIAAIIRGLYESGRAVFETEHLAKDGRRVPVEVSARLFDLRGSPTILSVARNVEERKRVENLLRIQRDLGVALGTTADLAEALRWVLEATLQVEGIDCGGVYIVDEATGGLNLAAHEGLSPPFVEISRHYAADMPQTRMVMKGEIICRRHADIAPAMDEVRQREGLRALAVIPVKCEGRVIAVLNLASRTHDEIPASTRHALESLAAQAGDVIVRLRTGEALRESEARYRTLFDGVPVGLYRTTPEGRIMDANQALVEMLGFPDRETLLAADVLDHYVDREDQARWQAALEEERAARGLEMRWRRHDGVTIWVRDVGRAVRGVDGRVLTYEGAVEEITAGKKAELDLAEAERRFRTLLDSVKLVAVGLDGEGNVAYANPCLLELTGYALAEVLGKSWFQTFIPERDRPEIGTLFGSILRDGIHPYYENPILTRDGEERLIAWNNTLLFGPGGEPVGTMSIGEDITARRKAEEALQKRNRELTVLDRAGRAFGSTLDLDQVLVAVLEEVRRLMDVTACSVWLVDPATGDLVCRQAAGPQSETVRGWRLPPGEGLAGWAVRQGESLIVADAQADARHFVGVDRETGLALRSILTVPLQVKDRVVGALQVVDVKAGRFGAQDLELLEPLAASAAAAIENARLYEALRASEEMYRTLLGASPDAIVVADLEGRVTYASPQACALYSVEDGEAFAGRSAADFVIPQDRERAWGDFQAMLHGGSSGSAEYVMQRQDGSRFIGELSVALVRDARGAPDAFIVVTRDMTERRRMEEALRERAAFERLISDISTHFVGLKLDEIDGGIARALQEVGEFVGADRCYVFQFRDSGGTMDNTHEWCAEGIESHVGRLQGLPADAFPWAIEALRRSETVHVPRVADLGPEAEAERDEFQAEGICSLVMVPMAYGGDILGFLGLDAVREQRVWSEEAVTLLRMVGEILAGSLARRRAEEALRRRTEELAALNEVAAALSRSPEMDQVLGDVLGEVLRLRLLETTGRGAIFLLDERTGALAMAARRGYPPDHPCLARPPWVGECLCGLVAEGGEAIVCLSGMQDGRHTRSFPEEQAHGDICLPLRARGQTVGVLALELPAGRGLTDSNLRLLAAIGDQIGLAVENARLADEAAEIEILQEVDRLRAELIANVSHELRTPLGLIKVFATTLLRDDVEFGRETQQEFLRDIDQETDRLERIVDNLLDLSRMEGGRLQLREQAVDVGKLAQGVMADMEIHLARHRLVHDFPPEPLVALADPDRVEQVLRNLLGNAVKYSPAAGAITVRGRGDRWQVLVSVSDEGIGIPTQDLERVFERFYRVESEISQEVSGAGLGLAVCKGIVEAHGGRIWAESELGEGSTFHFTLRREGRDVEGQGGKA